LHNITGGGGLDCKRVRTEKGYGHWRCTHHGCGFSAGKCGIDRRLHFVQIWPSKYWLRVDCSRISYLMADCRFLHNVSLFSVPLTLCSPTLHYAPLSAKWQLMEKLGNGVSINVCYRKSGKDSRRISAVGVLIWHSVNSRVTVNILRLRFYSDVNHDIIIFWSLIGERGFPVVIDEKSCSTFS
jgi:hypothetical protein